LWDPDDTQSSLEQPLRDRQRAVAADRDEGIDAHACRVGDDLARAIDFLERAVRLPNGNAERVAAVGRAKDGPAEVTDSTDGIPIERDDVVFAEEAVIPSTDAEHLPAPAERRQDGTPDDRVEPRRIAATGGDRDAHEEGTKAWL